MTKTMATGGGGRKPFEFRMSKKVAELTQVVHMLFTRNHEKEVELDAVKEAYEEEIQAVIHDAQQRIDKLEHRLRSITRELRQESEQLQAQLVRDQEELKQRLAEAEQQLAEEKKECQSARDLLIAAQNDIERLRRGQGEEAGRARRELEARSLDNVQLNARIQLLERTVREKDMLLGANKDHRGVQEKLQKEIGRLKELVETSEKAREECVAKNKQLESDVRQLRKELAKRATLSSAKLRQQEAAPPPTATVVDQSEEIDQLRKQIIRYRMELSNRESNFNRMFTEKQPINVDRQRRGGGVRGQQQGSLLAGEGLAQLRYTRERSMYATDPRQVIDTFHDVDQTQVTDLQSPTSSVASSSAHVTNGRLPHLSLDSASPCKPASRAGPRMLAKPKPLPRELISAKASP